MERSSWQYLRRLAVVARAGLSANDLALVAGLAPALAAVDEAGASRLASLGLTTRAAGALAGPDAAAIDADLRWLDDHGGRLLAAGDPDYPALLRESPDAPAVLYLLGHLQALAGPQIAMVGSRNPTAGGRDTARRFAAWFSQAGLGV